MSESPKPLHSHHGKPVTRRDFLSQGLIAFSATTFVPSLMGLLREAAWASECGPASAKSSVPFLVFDCAGGAAFPANFLVGKQGGPEDLLTNYDRLGWNPRLTGAIDKAFGLPVANVSQIAAGIRAVASAEARARLRMGSFCHFAQDDTSSNPLSAVSLVVKGGYKGSTISAPLGSRNTVSGGNSQAALADPAVRPLFAGTVNDVIGAVGLGGEPFTKVTPDNLRKMLKSAGDMSVAQATKLETSEQGKTLKRLLTCSYEENQKLLGTTPAVDARQDATFQQLYGINAQTQPNVRNAVFGSLVMNTLKGVSGPSVLTIAGCDYHDNTQTTGDAKDLEIGTEIGRAVEAAHRLKVPLFFQLLTDGGVSNRAGSRVWVSDSGERCMTIIGYYNPVEAREPKRLQVGHYTEGQGADRTTLIGAAPFKVGCAVYANYLRLTAKPEEFEKEFDRVVPKGTFQNLAELESLLIFA